MISLTGLYLSVVKKKKKTKALPTPSLSHCSKDTVHIRSWTPESWVNLPSLPAESNLKLMCSNGTPVANKGEKSRELQQTHERHNQRAEEDPCEKCKKSHSDLIKRNHWCMLEKAVKITKPKNLIFLVIKLYLRYNGRTSTVILWDMLHVIVAH